MNSLNNSLLLHAYKKVYCILIITILSVCTLSAQQKELDSGKKFTINNKSESNQNNERNYEIIDPIGRKIEVYRIVARELKNNLEKILDKILYENKK